MKIALMICLGLVAGAVMSVVELIAVIAFSVACLNFEVVLFKHTLGLIIVLFVGAYVSVQLWTLYHMARFNMIFAAAALITASAGTILLLNFTMHLPTLPSTIERP